MKYQHPYGGIAIDVIFSKTQARRIIPEYDVMPYMEKFYSRMFQLGRCEYLFYKLRDGRVRLTAITY